MYSWTLPGIVASVDVKVNSEYVAFYNYQSIPQNTEMLVYFDNDGHDVDVSSISVSLNGDAIESESEVVAAGLAASKAFSLSAVTEPYYSYDSKNGVITISDVGDSSGQITISATDLLGNSYPSMPIIFYTSADIEINQFLVYPNPYSPSITQSGLTFGYSLTEAATVKLYIYDATGREIARVASTAVSMGYNTQSWTAILDRTSAYIGSGTYYLKLIATATSDGDVVTATTKLVVY